MNNRIYLGIAICLFLVSFTLPAFYIDGPEKDAWSSPIALFLLGWLGLGLGYFSCISWLANPLFILAVLLFLRNKKIAVLPAVLAIACAVSFLFAHTIPLGESGNEAKIEEYKAGYWLWLTSIILLTGVMLIQVFRRTLSEKPV